jgi:hypothetical protein
MVTLEKIKRQAEILEKNFNLIHHESLDLASKLNDFRDWQDACYKDKNKTKALPDKVVANEIVVDDSNSHVFDDFVTNELKKIYPNTEQLSEDFIWILKKNYIYIPVNWLESYGCDVSIVGSEYDIQDLHLLQELMDRLGLAVEKKYYKVDIWPSTDDGTLKQLQSKKGLKKLVPFHLELNCTGVLYKDGPWVKKDVQKNIEMFTKIMPRINKDVQKLEANIKNIFDIGIS